MRSEHEAAVRALMQAFDARLAAAPLIDRRAVERDGVVDARRAAGPVGDDFAFWASNGGHPDTPRSSPDER